MDYREKVYREDVLNVLTGYKKQAENLTIDADELLASIFQDVYNLKESE
jgi:hypothetical protein